jgi:hypothetical protein
MIHDIEQPGVNAAANAPSAPEYRAGEHALGILSQPANSAGKTTAAGEKSLKKPFFGRIFR